MKSYLLLYLYDFANKRTVFTDVRINSICINFKHSLSNIYNKITNYIITILQYNVSILIF